MKLRGWKKTEAERQEPPSKTPRVDEAMERIIIDPSQRIYKVVMLAKELEIALLAEQERATRLEVMAKMTKPENPPPSAKPVSTKKPKKFSLVNPYDDLSNDEVMHRLRGFGFGSRPN